MTGVIIAADDRDKKMWKILPRILMKNLSAVFPDPGAAAGILSEESIVICRPEDAKRLRPDRAVVICNGGLPLPDTLPPGDRAVAVVDSANARAVEQIGESGLPAITCGRSTRDTLTLSSFGVDSAVLGLQRSVACFDGTVAEPQEIPCRLEGGIDSFALMASASIFVLTGNIEKLKSAVI